MVRYWNGLWQREFGAGRRTTLPAAAGAKVHSNG
jgi:hypothetical protein